MLSLSCCPPVLPDGVGICVFANVCVTAMLPANIASLPVIFNAIPCDNGFGLSGNDFIFGNNGDDLLNGNK